jgi:D-aspartate ligase
LHHAFACVLGGIDIVRPLGLAGVSCAVVPRPGGIARYSRFARKILPWADPREHPGELVDELVRFGRSQPEPPVLYFEEDDDLLFVSRHREALGTAFRFALAEAELVESLVDKERFQGLAAEVGLPVPRGRTFSPGDDSPAELDLPFPIVVKARTRRQEQWGRVAGFAKAIRVDSRQELEAIWPRLRGLGADRLLAQELVPGPETSMETYHSFTDGTGEVVAEFTGRKIRTYPRQHGVSTAVTTTDAADVRDLGRDVVRKLGLSGVAKVDCKRAPDGTLRVLEVNPRFSLWHHPGAFAGVNIPAIVHGELTGRPRRHSQGARAGVSWCWIGLDRRAARAAGVPFAEWARWAVSCEAKYPSWRDPWPFLRGMGGRR